MGTPALGATGPKRTDALRIYLAGYIDGEGCLSYRRGSITVAVDSIYPYTLRVFKKLYGGRITKRQHRPGSRKRISYKWRIYSATAAVLLEDVLPYLREKKPQAILCLALRGTPPGPTRQGLEAQLKSLKHVEYDEEEEEEEHSAD